MVCKLTFNVTYAIEDRCVDGPKRIYKIREFFGMEGDVAAALKDVYGAEEEKVYQRHEALCSWYSTI